jgi:hypothetical protein
MSRRKITTDSSLKSNDLNKEMAFYSESHSQVSSQKPKRSARASFLMEAENESKPSFFGSESVRQEVKSNIKAAVDDDCCVGK